MSAEEAFGRRLRYEREVRGWTQADVARLLDKRFGVRMHATAIAKMEQRDTDRPRAIRLDEAALIAQLFDLTLADMASPEGAFADLIKDVSRVVELQAEAGRMYLKIFGTLRRKQDSIMESLKESDESVSAVMHTVFGELAGSFLPAPSWYAALILDPEFGKYAVEMMASISEQQAARNRENEARGIRPEKPSDLALFTQEVLRSIEADALRARRTLEEGQKDEG